MKGFLKLFGVGLVFLVIALTASVSNAGVTAFNPGQVLTAAALNANFAAVVPIAGGVTMTGPLTVPTLSVTGTFSLSSALPVASGGTGAASASGTALDNVSGFSGTGLINRTGAGAYSFVALSSLLQASNNLSDIGSASTARTNLGLGTIATQAAASVAITGGTINGTAIGATTITGSSSVSLANRTITATTSAAAADYVVLVNATSAAVTYTLPAASSSTNRILVIQKIDSSTNTVTVSPNGSDTINGAASQAISTQYGAITVQSNGSTWTILQTTLATLG